MNRYTHDGGVHLPVISTCCSLESILPHAHPSRFYCEMGAAFVGLLVVFLVVLAIGRMRHPVTLA